MKTMGFVNSELPNEKRRALLPKDIEKIKHRSQIYIEKGYGLILEIEDEEYEKAGVHICSREKALQQDVICDLKIDSASYIDKLSANQTIFGWAHIESNPELVASLCKKRLTVIAWENMYKAERHVFWRNNKIAGEAGVLHALTLFGKLAEHLKVALIGRGNVSMGAYKTLSALGADVVIYNRETAKYLAEEIHQFDMIINGVLWDKSSKDHIINREDLKNFKTGAMIVDISADEGGAIETSRPTGVADPIYEVDGVIHYVVNHTPSLFYQSATKFLSKSIVNYIDYLIEDKVPQEKTLREAMIIEKGQIIDRKLNNNDVFE